ncbi:hypothetical protein, partial [Acidiphilium sp.]|uniref:hypothetical protein n=1 Tax=Acidiphilium sp. TaxID=527 RepID=UPI00258BA429
RHQAREPGARFRLAPEQEGRLTAALLPVLRTKSTRRHCPPGFFVSVNRRSDCQYDKARHPILQDRKVLDAGRWLRFDPPCSNDVRKRKPAGRHRA